MHLAELNIKNPDAVLELYKAYEQAGCDIITTNTFQGNRLRVKELGLEEHFEQINKEAVRLAKQTNCLVAGGIGPSGKYLQPLGELNFDTAYENFKEQIALLEGVDLILIETFTDLREAKAAAIAAKETLNVPIICTMAFEPGGRTITGTDVETAISVLTSAGASVVGANCGVSLEEMQKIAERFAKKSKLPFSIKPNAGMPKIVDGKSVFNETPETIAEFAKKMVSAGASIVGGCCGTSPEHLKAVAEAVKDSKPLERNISNPATLSSRTKTIELDNFTIIGERINPSNRKNLKDELTSGKTNIVRREALSQVREGANVLDVNASIVGADTNLLSKVIETVQNTTDAPLCIDTPDLEALELALKKSDGKPLINSTTGEPEKMEKVFALAKKYGASVIGLTIDENGMPKTAEERFEITKKIVEFGSKFIPKEDILIVCLTRTVSAEQNQAVETLKAVKMVNELGVKTILGVSNISHGLPNRPLLNASFLKLAKENGLNAVIYNPTQLSIEPTELAEKVLTGEDAGVSEYIKANADFKEVEEKPAELSIEERLHWDVIEGNDEDIIPAVETALSSGMDSMKISDKLIASLREIGTKFNTGEVFLPQVMMSAAAMKKALARLKQELKGESSEKGTILFATVKNDVHDIGKSIVIALLEANNYKVIDLGVDVDANIIVEKAKETNPDVIALSALMTTTVTNMPEVIKALKTSNISAPVMIGGAVVTEDYAEQIGATYSKDAVGAVELLSKLLSK